MPHVFMPFSFASSWSQKVGPRSRCLFVGIFPSRFWLFNGLRRSHFEGTGSSFLPSCGWLRFYVWKNTHLGKRAFEMKLERLPEATSKTPL